MPFAELQWHIDVTVRISDAADIICTQIDTISESSGRFKWPHNQLKAIY